MNTLRSARARFVLALLLTLVGLFSPVAAVADTELFAYLDLDNNPATGCSVPTADGPFTGAEQMLTTTVSTAGAPSVTAVARQICTAGVFGPSVAVSSPVAPPWPVGIGLGTGGSDVVETYLPLPGGTGTIRLGFSSAIIGGGPGDVDALLTTNGLVTGGPILLVTASVVEIPTLGEWGLLLSTLLLGITGLVVLRRRRRASIALGILLVVFSAGAVWAAITPDGAIGDWTGIAPLATDASGDAPVNANLYAAFGKVESSVLYLRLDVDVETDPAPSVTTTTPADGAANIATNSNITIDFSEPVNVTASAFTLECPAGSPVAFTLSPAAPGGVSSFTLDPTADLPAGVTCTVTVNASQVTDTDVIDPPDTMAANYSFSFTTDAAPAVTSTSPANAATGVAINSNITIGFNEPVNVTAGAFTLECPIGSPVAFTLSPAAPGGVNSFTLDPTADLPQEVTCTVTVVATQVTDTDANDPPDQMAANHVFSFTTDGAPAVTTTTPSNGATDVAANANITVNFSKPVNVTGSAFTLECPGGSPVAFTLSPVAPGGVASFTLDPTPDLSAGVTCTVTVVATEVTDVDADDPPDQMAANYVFSFTTDAAPAVTTTIPANGAVGVAPNSNITVNFSETVNVTGSAFTLECPVGSPVAFTLSPAAPGGVGSFTLDPTTDLPAGVVCTVTVVATQVTDTDANDPPDQMAANYVFTFTADAAPSVTTTSPTNGAVNVAANSNITVNFSELVNVTGSAFTLECPVGSPVAFTLSPAAPGGVASFTLDPTTDLPSGVTCTVTVVATQVTDVDANDPPDQMAANHVFSFTTDAAPSVTTTSPANGAINAPANGNITVNFSEPVNVTGSAFTLECPVGSPVAFTLSPAAPGGVASFTLDPTADLPGGVTCTVTVVATQVTDVDANDPPDQMAANHVFSFTTDTAPSVTTTSPTNGAANAPVNGNITVNFSEPVNVTGSAFTLECPVGSPVAFTLIPAAPGGVASFTLDPTVDLPSGVTCTVTVVATQVTDVDANDPPDQMVANYVFSFTTDAAPSVTTTSPVNGAANVASNSNITVNFSELVNVTGSAFTLQCPVGSPVAFTLIPAAPGGVASFTLDPTADLPSGVTCTVTVVATQVTDVDANDPPDQMAADYVFSFTTDAAPSVTTTSPVNGAANVASNSNITVNFSEPVNVTGSAFTLQCPVGSPVAFTLIPAAPGGVASFTLDPTADLPSGVTCTVTVVATQVTDVDANDPPDQMVANYVFSFTTDAAPSVTTTSPVNGAANVAANSNITVNFSEPVNVTGSAFTLQCPVGSPVAFTLIPAAPGGVASFTLDPTADLPGGVICTVTVVATQVTDVDANDPPDQMAANYVFSFTTDLAPSVTTTSPTNGAANAPVSGNITVNFSEPVNVTGSAFTLECPVGSPVAFTLIPAAPGGVASFTLDPTVDLPSGVTCTVTVVATQVTDVDANDPPDQMVANYVFSFTTDAAPSVTTTFPVNGAANVASNSNITVNFSEPVNVTGSAFTLQCPVGSPVAFTLIPAAPGGVASFTLDPTADLPSGVTCTVTVVATQVTDVDANDPPDQMAANYVFSFTTDAAPSVTTTSPVNGAANVASNSNITVNFSEPVNVTGSAFTLQCPVGSPVAFTLIPAAPGGVASFTLDPTADLPLGVTCTVTVVATQVTDVDANDPPDQMVANYVFSFTTDAAPSVTTTSPVNGAANVAANSNITVNFSEPVNVTGSAFTLQCPVGSPVAFTLIPAAPGGVASFTLDPTADLPLGVICTVTVVATQVTDVDANDPPDQMAANYVFSFTTDLAPNVTTTSPTNGATNVAANSNVTVNFSEPVNVTGSAFTLQCPVGSPVAFTLIPAAPGGVASFTLDPTTDLPSGVTCTVTVVATQVTDVDANDPPDQMAANYVFSFTTDVAPSVTTTSPVNGAVSVLSSATITVNFSESVNASGSSFQIECPSGSGARAYSLSVSPSASFTLTPSLPLPGNQTCTVTVLAGFITDVDAADPPDNMAANYVFSFTIANNPPQIVASPKETFDTIGNTAFEFKAAQSLSPGVFVVGNLKDNFTDSDGPSALFVERVVGCPDLTSPYDCPTANGGSVSLASNGEFSFIPKAGDTAASDSFTYRVSDGAATVDRLVTLNRKERVWYVKNNDPLAAPASDDGTSVDPFDTLAAAQTASAVNDYIFVYFGNGTSTGQAAGIVLKGGQHLIGEHAGLGVAITTGSFNGTSAPTTVPLVTAAPGNRPLVDHSGAGNNAVSATDAIPIQIVGLSLQSTNANAIDLTNAVALPASATLSIQNNVIRGAGAEGLDINLNAGTTGTLALGITGNTWSIAGTHTGNGVDVNRAAGTLQLDFSNNTSVVSAATAVSINGGAAANTTITGFANNTVHQNTAGSGIVISNATFDSSTAVNLQFVSGGTSVIGASGDGVGGGGLLMSAVTGELRFTDLDVVTSGGAGVSVVGTGPFTGAAGTRFEVGNVSTVDATGGPALDVNNATLDFQPTSLKSTNSASTGVRLVTVNGTFSAPLGSTITNAGTTDFVIDSTSAAVTYDGTITDDLGQLVSVSNSGGSLKSFTGAITDGDDGDGSGISLTGNSSTIRFSGGVVLSTGANAAFTATGGGTVEVCDENPCSPGTTGLAVNKITTTTGTALNVANVNIGANNLEFRSISAGTGASGPTNGIVLNNTSSAGGLKVKGTGSAGSGGTVQRTTGTGISLTDTAKAGLAYMIVQNSGDDGIFGLRVADFALDNTSVLTNGNSTLDEGLEFGNPSGNEVGVSGTVSITNCTFSANSHNNFKLRNGAGNLASFTVTNSSFNNMAALPNGANSFIFETTNTATVTTATISGSTFANNGNGSAAGSDYRALQVTAHGDTGTGNSSTISDFTVSGNTFTNNGLHAAFELDTAANLQFKMINNLNMTGAAPSHAIHVGVSSQTTGGVLQGRIQGNTIGNAAVAGSGSTAGAGINVLVQGRTQAIMLIDSNVIRQTYQAHGINVESRGPTVSGQPLSQSDITVTSNDVVPNDITGFPAAAIYVVADSQGGSPVRMRADIRGNIVPAGAAVDLYPSYLIFDELVAAAEAQLVDTAPASATCDAQLDSTNTGSASAGAGCALIAGPISTPP